MFFFLFSRQKGACTWCTMYIKGFLSWHSRKKIIIDRKVCGNRFTLPVKRCWKTTTSGGSYQNSVFFPQLFPFSFPGNSTETVSASGEHIHLDRVQNVNSQYVNVDCFHDLIFFFHKNLNKKRKLFDVEGNSALLAYTYSSWFHLFKLGRFRNF